MAVANICPLRGLAASWETERGDSEREQREGRNGSSWMDLNNTAEQVSAEEEDEEVEEHPRGKENGKSDHHNVALDDEGGDDDSVAMSSALSDDDNSSYTCSDDNDDGDGGSGDHNGNNFVLLSTTEEADDTEAGSDEIHRLGTFNSSTDENDQRTETTSEQGQDMDVSEKSSEDEEFDDDNDDDDDTNDETSEEYEEYPEKLYCQPAYSKKIFQALEEMKQSSFLTDLLLITDSGHSFQAHSLVLAAVSTVIQKVLQETNEEMMFLRLAPEVSGFGLSSVLEFAYTGTIAGLNRETLAQIQTAALCLGVSRVLQLCNKKEERGRKKDDGKEMVEKVSAEEQWKLSLESIRQLWEERVGCDVELEAEGRIFRAHKVLLTASSDYFHAMFSSGMKESQQTSITLLLVGAPELGILLECSYSGALALDWGIVFELTCTALQFQFQPALSLCLSFMQQEMDAHSCLDVAAFAEAYGMSELQDMANDFVLRHFEEVAATLKFQDLPAEKLKTYLHSNSLCVASELPVLKAVISWIGANPRRRVKEARELLATVHFPLMTFKEFKEVKAITTWPKVTSEDLYESLLEEFCSSNFNVHTYFRTYLPKEALVLVGGEKITENFDKRTPCREIWFSNSFRNHVGVMKRVEWRLLGDLPEKPRFSHSVGVIKGNLYVVGGRHYYGKTDTMNCTYRFDPMQNSWQRLADMQERRGSFALVVLDERIYAIGGDKDSEANVESVEVYCPSKDSWSFIHPLDQPLSGHAASVWNGKIFISGGFDCRYQCLVSMLLYHPDKGTTYLADMSQNRAQHCMETFQDRLYVAGGVSDAGGQVVDQLACEFYDPVRDIWATIMPMSVPHVSAASAVLEGKIYIIGGYCEEDYSDMKRVHRYDPVTQCWENMCGTPGPTTYIAACVLPIPPHLRQL
ncbi:hypothetical protein MHYP_G00242120 [Metynnis hypsauchen]